MKRIALLIVLGALLAAQPVDAKPVRYSMPGGCQLFWPASGSDLQTCWVSFRKRGTLFGERQLLRCTQEVLLDGRYHLVRFIGYPFCFGR